MPNSEELRYLGEAVHKLSDIANAVTDRAVIDQLLQYKFDALNERLDQLVSVVTTQAKVIRDFEDERHKKEAVKGAVKFIWGALVAGVGAVAYVLHDVITAFFLPPKH